MENYTTQKNHTARIYPEDTSI